MTRDVRVRSLEAIEVVTGAGSPPTSPRSRQSAPLVQHAFDSPTTTYSTLPASLSLAANVCLALAKVLAYLSTSSLVLLASAMDSVFDVAAGLLLYTASRSAERAARDRFTFPRGAAAFEPIAVVAFAAVMTIASLQIAGEALMDLFVNGERTLQLDVWVLWVLVCTIAVKAVLYVICNAAAVRSGQPAVLALAHDHMSDLLTNSVAVGCLVAAAADARWWLLDPLGAIAISVIIARAWIGEGIENAQSLNRVAAPNEVYNRLLKAAAKADVATFRHFLLTRTAEADRYDLDVDVSMPADMTVAAACAVTDDLSRYVRALDGVTVDVRVSTCVAGAGADAVTVTAGVVGGGQSLRRWSEPIGKDGRREPERVVMSELRL